MAAGTRRLPAAPARVVEVGCGDGRLTPGIAEHAASVLAFDPDEIAVARARAVLPDALAGRVTYRVDSASGIGLRPSSFDVVVFSWTL